MTISEFLNKKTKEELRDILNEILSESYEIGFLTSLDIDYAEEVLNKYEINEAKRILKDQLGNLYYHEYIQNMIKEKEN